MSQTKKQLITAAFNHEAVDRVPVGFWYHFLNDAEHVQGVGRPEVVAENIAGLKRFYEDFKPDFIKIMSDGFFAYPNDALKDIRSIKDAAGIEPVGELAPWIEEQVRLTRTAASLFGEEVLLFYNIFAAPRYLEFIHSAGDPNGNFVKLLNEDKAGLKRILDVVSDDLAALARRVIVDGHADGIYLSVQNIPRPEVTREIYDEIIAPAEKKILAAANAVSQTNILHICGYEGSRNELAWYQEYKVQAVSYAAHVEGVPLSEGKRIFPGKTVIGGFDNTKNGALYSGTKEEVERKTEEIIKDAGTVGVILGADCTLPSDIELNRLTWVRDKAASLT